MSPRFCCLSCCQISITKIKINLALHVGKANQYIWSFRNIWKEPHLQCKWNATWKRHLLFRCFPSLLSEAIWVIFQVIWVSFTVFIPTIHSTSLFVWTLYFLHPHHCVVFFPLCIPEIILSDRHHILKSICDNVDEVLLSVLIDDTLFFFCQSNPAD